MAKKHGGRYRFSGNESYQPLRKTIRRPNGKVVLFEELPAELGISQGTLARAGFEGRPKSNHRSIYFNQERSGGMLFPTWGVPYSVTHDEHLDPAREARVQEHRADKARRVEIAESIALRSTELQRRMPRDRDLPKILRMTQDTANALAIEQLRQSFVRLGTLSETYQPEELEGPSFADRLLRLAQERAAR